MGGSDTGTVPAPRPVRRARLAVVALATAVVSFVAAIASPLREPSADMVPGRIGGAVLRCAGTFDLARVDWVHAITTENKVYYWMRRDRTRQYTSVFGPAPAIVGALALLDFGEGDTIDDDTLRRRERAAGAALLAIAAGLMVIAAAARASLRRSALTGLVAAGAFCGAATLGQGLWQATTALPFLVGALATFAWRERWSRVALATPALLAVAVMLRPTIAPLALGLGVAWLIAERDRKRWAIAGGVALLAVAPLVVWNAIHLWSPLPIGQWRANTQESGGVFGLTNAPEGLAGLLVSPARGLVWFAPLALVGAVAALRSQAWRLVAAGVVLQLIAMALFVKWHGGQAYGPRMLAEACWFAIFLALGADLAIRPVLLAITGAVTMVVGQLGLWSWTPLQWEIRRRPEAHHEAFWDFVDSPIAATVVATPHQDNVPDSPPTPALECVDGKLRSRH